MFAEKRRVKVAAFTRCAVDPGSIPIVGKSKLVVFDVFSLPPKVVGTKNDPDTKPVTKTCDLAHSFN